MLQRASRLLCLWMFLFPLVSMSMAWVKPAMAQTKQSSSGVVGVVRTEGALVYSKPNFDAKIIATLKAGQRVRVTRGTTGDVAQFHKVRVGKRIGYIVDIDISVPGARSQQRSQKNVKAKAKAKAKTPPVRNPEKKRDELPIYFTRYVGVLLGQVQFKEDISGVDAEEDLMTYGLKITGPDVFFDGPVMDVNLALHYGAPSYYDSLSATKPSGFVLFSDALLVLPLTHGHNSMFYISGGPLLVFSRFLVTRDARPMTLTALHLGASFAAGGAVRFRGISLRGEVKQMVEKQSYRSFQLSVQTDF